MLAKYVASFAWTSTKNEWNAENTICSRAFGPSIARYRTTHVLTIYHVKLKQSTAIEQKHFDRRSLSPALPNLWFQTPNLIQSNRTAVAENKTQK